jgi:hypothetical protein
MTAFRTGAFDGFFLNMVRWFLPYPQGNEQSKTPPRRTSAGLLLSLGQILLVEHSLNVVAVTLLSCLSKACANRTFEVSG